MKVLKNTTASEIDLPMRNLYNMTNAAYYYAYANKTFYQIAINADLSVDVLKVDILKYE